jgi:putative ABC transport system permease protein
MYPDPRWRKVLRDLWRNKTRAILVVLSIAVGVFAVGTVAHMRSIVSKDLAESYASVNPADAVIFTNQPFDDELVQVVRRIEGVREAEGVTSTMLRFHLQGEAQWYSMRVLAISDYEEMRLNLIRSEDVYGPDPERWSGGAYPPANRELMIDRTSMLMATMGLGNARLNDTLVIQTVDGREREMPVTGVAYDFARTPATFSGMARGYVTLNTMEWLGGSREYNELNLTVAGNPRDVEAIQVVANRVREKIESSGRTVLRVQTNTPGEPPMGYLFTAFTLILGVLGLLSLFLSAFLVINTITALLSQQVRQIGVMKAVGATASQITGMYLVLVVFFGLASLLVAVPSAVYATEWFVNFMAYFLNFKLPVFRIPGEVIVLEVAMAMLVPVLAALYPILAATRMTVREAITNYGIENSKKPNPKSPTKTQSPRLGFGSWDLRLVPRPLLLSLRNTFRRRSRVAFTMMTLVLATTLFVAVFSVRASLYLTLDTILNYWQFDVEAYLKQPYPMQRLEDVAYSIQGVTKMEAWLDAASFRLRPDGTQSKGIGVYAVPAETVMWQPKLLQGRWLMPDDEDAIVVNTDLLKDNPDVKLGDEIVLKIEGEETTWQVVGVFQSVPMIGPTAHVHYPYFARLVHTPGRSDFIGIATDQHDSASTLQVARELENEFKQAGVNFNFALTNTQQREGISILFDIIISFLMAMAILIAAVGGLGLMGTMSLNVLERTREIGVMRAIGASDGMIRLIIVAEGLLIGFLSWLIGTVIALPLGKILGDAVGMGMMQSALTYTFSIDGALYCLIGMLVIAGLSSWFPAQNASRLTVRQVLAYDG